jgi:ribosomal-protein-alanine N-acetyltransferase
MADVARLSRGETAGSGAVDPVPASIGCRDGSGPDHEMVSAMLHGDKVTLRPVLASDLDRLYGAHIDIDNRGAYFPRGVQSETAFKRAFSETGFWQPDEGMFLIFDGDEMAGHIEFFKPVNYWDALELSYQLYDDRFAGRGFVTEAVRLTVDYLFATKKFHRIHLVIVPENAASRRIAEKCGFVFEGTARGAFFNGGRNQDVMLYSLLRTDPRPWGEGSPRP